MHVFRFLLGLFAVIMWTSPFALQAQTADSLVITTINDEQAVRGDRIFNKACVECHTKSDITGADFRIKWNARPVFDLFERIRTTMPDANPGSMTREEYIDVVTYMLKLNGAPSGGTPLLPDSLALSRLRMDIAPPKPPGSAVLTHSNPFRRVVTMPIHAKLH